LQAWLERFSYAARLVRRNFRIAVSRLRRFKGGATPHGCSSTYWGFGCNNFSRFECYLLRRTQDDPQGKIFDVAFRKRLSALGWVEGRNLEIQPRWAAGDLDRVKVFAKELTALSPEVLLGITTSRDRRFATRNTYDTDLVCGRV
jgi:hypothetical protein